MFLESAIVYDFVPIDLITDLTPMLGYIDDGVILSLLGFVSP